MNRFLLLAVLLVFQVAPAQERVATNYFWRELVPDANHRIFMANEETIVCYAGRVAPKDFFVLTRVDNSFEIRRITIPGLPEKSRELAPGVESKPTVGDIGVATEGGELLIYWLQQVNGAYKIHVLRIGRAGETTHHEIKEFPAQNPVFRLRMYVLGKGDLQFFYIYHSEEYLSPISDTGDIAKLWALRWRDGKTQFDRQLSESGRVQSSSYEARKLTQNQFDLVWNEDRHGVFGFRHRLGAGRLTLSPTGPRFEEMTDLRPLTSTENDQMEFITQQPIATDEKGNSTPVISLQWRSDAQSQVPKEVTRYRILDLNGRKIRDFDLPQRASAVSYDEKSRLWRYVATPLYAGTRPTSGKFNVHWTDLAGHNWNEEFILPPDNVAHLEQAPGDCFYWLQGDESKIQLKSACRRAM